MFEFTVSYVSCSHSVQVWSVCVLSVLSVRFIEYKQREQKQTDAVSSLFRLTVSRVGGHGAFTCLVFKGPRLRLCAALNATQVYVFSSWFSSESAVGRVIHRSERSPGCRPRRV